MVSTRSMKLNKRNVEGFNCPCTKDQAILRDSHLVGFALRATKNGAKSFIVEKRVNGRVVRITIGRYPNLTVEQARIEAQKILAKIATGIDPLVERKTNESKAITLQIAFNDYIRTRKSLKPTTIKDYQRVLHQVMPDWLNKRLIDITKEMVSKRHIKYGTENSEARANLAMRVLRAIFNFAQPQYFDDNSVVLDNPVKKLSHTRSWYRVERRSNVIKAHDLAQWYKGLMRLDEIISVRDVKLMQDYFLLILFTGLRRTEAAAIRHENVDLVNRTFKVKDTKNRTDHILPMSDFLYELFCRRNAEKINEFVFPAKSSSTHLIDPRKTLIKIRELSGVHFTIHDMRRSFITVAESIDIPVYALKKLLNHKMRGDITAGYVIIDVERLRKPMQQITDYLLKAMSIKETHVEDINVIFRHSVFKRDTLSTS